MRAAQARREARANGDTASVATEAAAAAAPRVERDDRPVWTPSAWWLVGGLALMALGGFMYGVGQAAALQAALDPNPFGGGSDGTTATVLGALLSLLGLVITLAGVYRLASHVDRLARHLYR